jgi:uncharacterized DUF497 family protein
LYYKEHELIFITYPPIWEQEVIDNIWRKHHVAAEEVEEALYDDKPACIAGTAGSHPLFGQTLSGRHLLIVLRRKGGKSQYKIITAREMQEKEKRYYQKH